MHDVFSIQKLDILLDYSTSFKSRKIKQNFRQTTITFWFEKYKDSYQ